MTRHMLLLAIVFLLAGVASAQSSEKWLDLAQSLAHSRLVDLTYSYDENTIIGLPPRGSSGRRINGGPRLADISTPRRVMALASMGARISIVRCTLLRGTKEQTKFPLPG